MTSGQFDPDKFRINPRVELKLSPWRGLVIMSSLPLVVAYGTWGPLFDWAAADNTADALLMAWFIPACVVALLMLFAELLRLHWRSWGVPTLVVAGAGALLATFPQMVGNMPAAAPVVESTVVAILVYTHVALVVFIESWFKERFPYAWITLRSFGRRPRGSDWKGTIERTSLLQAVAPYPSLWRQPVVFLTMAGERRYARYGSPMYFRRGCWPWTIGRR